MPLKMEEKGWTKNQEGVLFKMMRDLGIISDKKEPANGDN